MGLPSRWFVVVVAAMALTVSCSGASESDDVTTVDDVIVETEPTAETFDASDPDQLAGVSTNPSKLEPGDCFNEYVYRDRSDFLQQITTIVGCDGPHDREAYFATEYPGGEDEPAPAEETLRRWAEGECLDEFEEFVGLEYVLSELEIGVVVPTFERWTDDGDRNVICYVYPDLDGHRLLTSVEDAGL